MMNGASLRGPAEVSKEEIDKLISAGEGKDEDSTKKKKVSKKVAKALPKVKGANKQDFTVEDDKGQTVSMVAHDKKVKELQTKIDKLQVKNDDLSKVNKTLKSDLTKSNKAYESEKTKRMAAEEKLAQNFKTTEDLKKELKALRAAEEKKQSTVFSGKDKEIDDLRKSLVKSNNKLKDAEDKISALETKNGELGSQITTLNTQISELKDDNQKLQTTINEMPAQTVTVDQDSNYDVVISRISATEFQSDAFTSSRYKVNLSRDCTYMTFRVDILGSAVCVNGTISLPALAQYLPFGGKKDYHANVINGEMRIEL